jgi:hypothetical protein
MTVPALASSLLIDGLDGPGSSTSESVANDTTLWSLVGGATVSTPPGDYANNPILRYYVVANGGGISSVFSMGEIDPGFGGTNAAPYIAVNGSSYSLIDPNLGAAGRDVSNLTSLQILAVPALPNAKTAMSTAVQLSGLTNSPGTYNLSGLQALPSATATELFKTPPNDVYTGVPLWTFLNPSSLSNVIDEIVITQATDGYEVVLSLAELDPSLGGNPNNLLAYADTATAFPSDGVARILLPGDGTNHGRFNSNVDAIEVANATPLPPTWTMMLIGLAGLGFVAYRRQKQTSALPV